MFMKDLTTRVTNYTQIYFS